MLKSKKIKKFINFLKILSKTFTQVICCLLCFIGGLSSIWFTTLLPIDKHESWSSQLIYFGRFAFFKNNWNERVRPEDITCLDIALAVLAKFSTMTTSIFYFIAVDLITPIAVLTSWMVTTSFTHRIRSDPDGKVQWTEILVGISSIRRLTEETRDTFGSIILTFMATSILRITMNLNGLVNTKDFTDAFFVLTDIMVMVVITLAADCNGQVCPIFILILNYNFYGHNNLHNVIGSRWMY